MFGYEFWMLFVLTVVSAVIGNLRTISLSKGKGIERYFITGVDSVFFVLIIGNVGKNSGVDGVMSFVVGKLLGIFIADLCVNRMYKTVYVVHLYVGSKWVESVEGVLFGEDFSFTRFMGNYLDKKQSMFTIQVNDEQKKILLGRLKDLGIENPTMSVSETKVYGKIKNKVVL